MVKWKVSAILLLIGVLGVGSILIAERITEPWAKALVLHIGIALLAGAVIGLVFELLLIRNILDLVQSQIDQAVQEYNERDREIRRVGIRTAYPRFGLRSFINEIPIHRPDRSPVCVRVMQSWIHNLDVFRELLVQTVTRGQRIEILVGHPDSSAVCCRLHEAHGYSVDEASRQMRNNLVSLLNYIWAHEYLREALKADRCKIRLYDGRPAATLFGIDRDVLVSWFFRESLGISTTQVRCWATTDDPKKLDAHSEHLADKALVHFYTLWSEGTVIPIDWLGTTKDGAHVPSLRGVSSEAEPKPTPEGATKSDPAPLAT